MPVATLQTLVQNKMGLHARPAMQFVDVANQFESEIKVVKGGSDPGEADGKSIMGMLTLVAEEGTPFTITAEGPDAESAAAALVDLFVQRFGEGE